MSATAGKITVGELVDAAVELALNLAAHGGMTVHFPVSFSTQYLLYRAGMDHVQIAELYDTTPGVVANRIGLVMEMMKYPSVAQAMTAAVKHMPKLPPVETCEIIRFPGPSRLATTVVEPLTVA